MSIYGVDYSWQRPSIPALVAAGKRFVSRYVGPGSYEPPRWPGDPGKHLDPTEARALIDAGLPIMCHAEGVNDGLLGGFTAGAEWARKGDEMARACGMPPDRPIYLSVDFDCTATQWPQVLDALFGAASVIGEARVGVYGGYRTMIWARRDGAARWFHQTYAWSGGLWAPGNNVEQYANGVSLGGATLDLDRALTADFGQWGVDDMALTDRDAQILIWRVHALINNLATVGGGPTAGETNDLQVALNLLQKDVDSLQARPPVVPAPIDPAALKAVLLDPAVLAAYGEAVADEDHRRSAA